MKSYKTKIIKKYGTDVKIHRYLGDLPMQVTETKALLGRIARTNTNMKAFESQREGIFVPDLAIDGGDFVINEAHGEEYVVVATHTEYDRNHSLAVVANLLKCTHRLNLKGNKKVADARGNIKTALVDKYKDVPCYIDHISSQLLQYEAGLHPDTEHLIYTTDLNIDLTDQIVVNWKGKETVFKVVVTDYLSFPNLVVIEVATDVRK